MKPRSLIRFKPIARTTLCALVAAIVAAGGVVAQEMIVPPSDPSPSEAAPAEGLASDEVVRWARMVFRRQYGPIRLDPYFNYRFVHADGIQSRPGEEVSTNIQTITPGVNVFFGEDWSLNYSPIWTIYSNEEFQDKVGHSATLAGKWQRDDWNLQFNHAYRASSTPLIETGQQTERTSHTTQINVLRRFTDRTSVEVALLQNLRYATGFADSRDFSNDDWLHYGVLPWATLSAGLGFGYSKADDESPDSTMIRYRARLAARIGEKMTLKLHGGIEDRSFEGSDGEDMSTPIYGADLVYRPFETTTFVLRADRTVATSYFQSQVTRQSHWRAELTQRLLGRFFLTVDATRQESDFEATVNGVLSGREDRGTIYGAKLGTNIRRFGSVSIFYIRTKNESNRDEFAFSSNQIGFQASYRF